MSLGRNLRRGTAYGLYAALTLGLVSAILYLFDRLAGTPSDFPLSLGQYILWLFLSAVLGGPILGLFIPILRGPVSYMAAASAALVPASFLAAVFIVGLHHWGGLVIGMGVGQAVFFGMAAGYGEWRRRRRDGLGPPFHEQDSPANTGDEA